MRGERNFFEHRQQEPAISSFDPKRGDGPALFNELSILLIGNFIFADRKGRHVLLAVRQIHYPNQIRHNGRASPRHGERRS